MPRPGSCACGTQAPSIAALLRRDATAPGPLEQERLVANCKLIRTPEMISGGFGNITMSRIQGAIDTVEGCF